MSPIKVLIVDDYPLVRMGIRELIEDAPDIQVVGECGSGHEALSLVEELAPDILILDMELPDIKGSEVAQQLRARGTPVRILALSAYDDKEFVLGLLDIGASGYLIKDEVADKILEAIRGIAQGHEGWLSRKITAQLPGWLNDERKKPTSLTSRELEVLRAMVAGQTNQEIAHKLGISEKTVEKHSEMIFTKLKVASRVEAAVLAVREGLV